jgi:oligopeptide/dipeptide ABC transporter ATP-binding protein
MTFAFNKQAFLASPGSR